MTPITVPRIATQEDNEAALARLMAMDPDPGSPEEAEMDVLATLIEAFERKRSFQNLCARRRKGRDGP